MSNDESERSVQSNFMGGVTFAPQPLQGSRSHDCGTALFSRIPTRTTKPTPPLSGMPCQHSPKEDKSKTHSRTTSEEASPPGRQQRNTIEFELSPDSPDETVTVFERLRMSTPTDAVTAGEPTMKLEADPTRPPRDINDEDDLLCKELYHKLKNIGKYNQEVEHLEHDGANLT
ncbi:hypothetical protein CROQUDRAFT_88475 [Cronartium quercuum f. sp. fusiforme G11]|uniref:Uncharacterized protein n=1 Tax=Cronartium quercuum f. sp. fusiforme G11 TaxID=708437 RepID=A0A9P6NQ01_9BASI|nr:hypothetical protein CROQUDRAFT_88475 [Cronartium quercuum f. sp. fusiforme G11]